MKLIKAAGCCILTALALQIAAACPCNTNSKNLNNNGTVSAGPQENPGSAEICLKENADLQTATDNFSAAVACLAYRNHTLPQPAVLAGICALGGLEP